MSSVVLGTERRSVEFTGALAGFTLALNEPRLVALTGSITGIAAALSMAASEYLSTKSDATGEKHPLRAALCTGTAYLVTVAILIIPYLLFSKCRHGIERHCFGRIDRDSPVQLLLRRGAQRKFQAAFFEMALLSFGIAGISFLIGYGPQIFYGHRDVDNRAPIKAGRFGLRMPDCTANPLNI